jgi:NADH-quinone oxidoreductase subunit A
MKVVASTTVTTSTKIKEIRFSAECRCVVSAKSRLVAMPSAVISPVLDDYGFVALILIMAFGLALLAAGAYVGAPRRIISVPTAWSQFRFGYAVYALIFLAFDMEMIFMYPWAVVFADIGLSAFLDMLVFIVLLGAGIAYAWGMGGLQWE